MRPYPAMPLVSRPRGLPWVPLPPYLRGRLDVKA